MDLNLSTGTVTLKQLQCFADPRATRQDRLGTRLLMAGDRSQKRPEMELRATRRFWTSLLARFALSDTVFQYFSPQEVFNRITKVRGNGGDVRLRYTIDHSPKDGPRMLAVVAPDAPVMPAAELTRMLAKYKAQDLQFADGCVTGKFHPRTKRDLSTNIGGDQFTQRFCLDIPVDGYGKPSSYLEMLRLVCLNGAIGMAPAFRSTINPGKLQPLDALERTILAFDNPEGFQAMWDRFDIARRSMLSVREAAQIWKLVVRSRCGHPQLLADGLRQVLGDFTDMYGLVNLDLLPAKKQAVLPAKCRVYDAINLVTELATHHAPADDNRKFQAFLGQLLSSHYDLEGMADEPEYGSAPAFIMPNREQLHQPHGKLALPA